jgi:hypothetical protein
MAIVVVCHCELSIKRGFVCQFFTMSFAGVLEVLVVEGKGLKSVSALSKQDPYVKLMMDVEQVRSKVHNNGGKNPTWNQTLCLNVIPGQTILKVECWDSDLVSDDYIGGAVVNLEQILKTGSQDMWVDLRSQSGSNSGQIRLVVYFKSKNVEAPKQFGGHTPYAAPVAPQAQYSPAQQPLVQQYYVNPPPPMPQATYAYAPAPPAIVQQQYAPPVMVQQQYAPPPQQMYPPTQQGHPGPYQSPPQQQGYPPQKGYPSGYQAPPQQMPGYPTYQPGFPPQQQMAGYPPQNPSQQGSHVVYNNGGYPGQR